ncbi:DMT family transporter [Natronoflexus pectinivorans]|uniref:EamA domain-containing membrane protein RarD n=1 Tax=Natronoflexus pectinivorans TaxID=682526 RepID=A0A4R2GNE1_9BACT|nr:DMT family transporter [Natronoflexus pectinivorans]TCO10783.1 EamA domain-containing membrane protein RarD [Natronoflexus pectinivorans]
MKDSTKGILLACLSALMWGLLAIALKIALNYTDSYTIVWWRFAASFFILTFFYLFRSPRSLRVLKNPPKILLLGGVLLGINFYGFQQGIEHAGPAVSQVIIQAGPVNLALIGFIIFKEKINFVRITGFLLAATGFYFFYHQQMQVMPDGGGTLRIGALWTFAGALAWTGYAIINKIMVKRMAPMQINLIIYGIPALLFIPFADFQTLFVLKSPIVWLLFLFLALNTILAYGGLSIALKYTEANRISMIVTLNPIITFIILEILLLMNVHWFESPPMAPMAYIGALMVLGGVALAVGARKVQWKWKRTRGKND